MTFEVGNRDPYSLPERNGGEPCGFSCKNKEGWVVPQSCPGWDGIPVLSWLGVVPLSWDIPPAGTEVPPWPGLGYPPLARTGVPPWERTWDWGSPLRKGHGIRDLEKNLGLGYPPPPRVKIDAINVSHFESHIESPHRTILYAHARKPYNSRGVGNFTRRNVSKKHHTVDENCKTKSPNGDWYV